ncbi:MAG: helix-hairpin-helix domain-containing protein [Bacteroidales bacterium]
MKRILLLLSTICLFQWITSQNIEIQREEWRYILEERGDPEVNEQDINNLIEQLSERTERPFNINTVSKEELGEIPFLTDLQIENLLYYRYTFGELKTMHELRLVEDFDASLILLITPFFRIEESLSTPVDNRVYKPRQELLIRFDSNLNKKEGYVDKPDSVLIANPNKQYVGSPFYTSLRYRFEQRNRLRFGITLEKDAGEQLFREEFPFVDFFSFYLQIRNRGFLKNLLVGNFKAHFGAGLVINNGFGFGKTANSGDMMFRNQGVTPHTGTDEYNYLQGIAATMQFSRWLLTPFCSYRRIDAVLNRNDGISALSSIKKDGVHNLFREVNKRNKATLFTVGTNLGFTGNFYRIGATAIYHKFNFPYLPPDRKYAVHQFKGGALYNFSVDYFLRKNNISLSGEWSMGEHGKFATVNKIEFYPANSLTFLMIQRYYDPGYHSWFSKSFSEGGDVSNETGYYLAASFKPVSGVSVNMAFDFFRFPWLKYGVDKPSSGYETIFQISYQPMLKLKLAARYRLKKRDKNRVGALPGADAVESYQRQVAGINLTSVVSDFFYFRSAIEGTFYKFTHDPLYSGVVISQSIGYKMSNFPLQADLNCAFFDTDNVNVKVYLSEKHVLYGFGIPSFYGNGMRYASNLKLDISSNLTVWLKFALTSYFDRDEIGTALEKIEGSSKHDIWTLIRYKF